MRNPFPDNPVFSQFLGLKDYFKKHQTVSSYHRIREIAKIARIIQSTGDDIAFDILGSVNFGMANEKSDVDLVMYIYAPEISPEVELCYDNCPRLRFYEVLIIHSLVHEISREKYTVHAVDYINLASLKHAIESGDYKSDIVARFVFYRTICRGVNKRILHPYEKMLMSKPELFHEIEETLTDALIEFTRTSSHNKSFQKYIDRLQKMNIHISESILEKVMDYLDLSKG